VLTAVLGDQIPVHIVEKEEPLQLGARRFAEEPTVRRDLVVAQELHGHGRSAYAHR